MPGLATLLRRGGDGRWRQTVERWRTALPVRGSATTNRDSSAHERAETQRRHGLSRQHPRADPAGGARQPDAAAASAKASGVPPPRRDSGRGTRCRAVEGHLPGASRLGDIDRGQSPAPRHGTSRALGDSGVLPSLDAAVLTDASIGIRDRRRLGRHRFRGWAMRVLVLPRRALSAGMVRWGVSRDSVPAAGLVARDRVRRHNFRQVRRRA